MSRHHTCNVLCAILIGMLLEVITPQAKSATAIADLPTEPEWPSAAPADWLLDEQAFEANVYRTANNQEIVLANGLVRRVFRLAPNGATVALDNLMTSQSLLRAVRPEAVVEVNGVRYDIGGLKGQRNQAFLLPEWLGEMAADPKAFRLTGFEVGEPVERFAWKTVLRV